MFLEIQMEFTGHFDALYAIKSNLVILRFYLGHYAFLTLYKSLHYTCRRYDSRQNINIECGM